MSIVLNVILTAHAVEDEGFTGIAFINRELANRNRGLLAEVDQFAGGRKNMEALVFMGAFNMVPIDDFLEWVRRAPWVSPENVRVFAKDEGDEAFEQVWPEKKDSQQPE